MLLQTCCQKHSVQQIKCCFSVTFVFQSLKKFKNTISLCYRQHFLCEINKTGYCVTNLRGNFVFNLLKQFLHFVFVEVILCF